MKKVLPLLIAGLMAISVPVMGQSGLGKGSGSGGGSGGSSGGSSGGNSGGGAPPPPVRTGGGSGGSSGGGQSNPPVRGGGSGGDQRGAPPVSNGGGLGRGQGSSQGQQAPIPTRQQGAPSRSGNVTYGGSNNQVSRSRGPQELPPPPVVRGDSRSTREAYGEDRVTRNVPGYRNGYYHYDQRWRDDNYWYPHYQFNYNNNCVPSPFYSYAHLPGYVNVVRIDFNFLKFEWRTGSSYRWSYDNRDDDFGWGWGNNDRRTDYLDDSIDDLYDAFARSRIRYMDRLIPTRDWVSIELNNCASYRITGDDFYDLMQDLVEGTRTLDYRIREVRQDRGRATVIAEHIYLDSWGRQKWSRHYYGLTEDRRGYRIAAFRID